MILDEQFIKWIKPSFKQLYACQKNLLDLPVFKQESNGHHHRRRPDFIGLTYSNQWVAIEYEDGDTFGKITKGIAQLEDIWRNVTKTNSQILINNIEIKPKYFLLATQYSKEGYLWKNDKRTIEFSGYDEISTLQRRNYTIFCLSRMMWRLCGRMPYSETNPIGVSTFGIIEKGDYNEPIVELNGKNKFKLKYIGTYEKFNSEGRW